MTKNNSTTSITKKKCFVISPIGKEGSEVRKRSDDVYEYILTPVLLSLNYDFDRADKIATPGLIGSQIIKRLVEADLVIADLTGSNPNVFYELAVRHTIGKPVVQMISKGETLPFDITNSRTIFFDHHDLASVEQCKKDLELQIKATESDPKNVDNPVITVFDLISVRGSDNPVEKLLGDIFSTVVGFPEQLHNIQLTVSKLSGKYNIDFNKEETNAEARFIDGETEAFAVLTEVTRQAKNTVRSSRFFPESVLMQPTYVSAMEQRIQGTDGKPPLKHYYRIVALNNPIKQKDIIHHLNSFAGYPFTLYLTNNDNAFELVIVDDTDAFIHFYKEEKVIASTLHIKGKMVVSEFIEIFNKLKNRGLVKEFNCEKITRDNLIKNLEEVDNIFKKNRNQASKEKEENN
ncbi:hypothetical protein EST62_12250 [Chlorobaculum sp. 24CR]|uniref:hypothetical protein n=1 Tax=Chlorobaculum sp. 24CR TaxID=2508878 RepID=UPI00100BD6FF|nr:hypothetical protein [Chlorobaculum sp. 24CR]RXK81083.1 hypothetical protein EST62_12250 [Chlorobaculum sp. 24CR]